ncbi:hypothetical protein FE257_006417 [Aspergillus nanangensis]|uniref:SET domain-containing protein n=1 Tax=Aspergillus nanangensis TaxID=2582783 RepID=A0AAD4CXW4_ASPNN|nr:hypothetical protein FE257_006417 [Aspergillus nanangensis]
MNSPDGDQSRRDRQKDAVDTFVMDLNNFYTHQMPGILEDVYENFSRKALKKATEVMATIFFDIFLLYCIKKAARHKLKPIYAAKLKAENDLASSLVTQMVAGKRPRMDAATPNTNPLEPPPVFLGGFVDAVGWKMFAICACAEGFRRACEEQITGQSGRLFWDHLGCIIRENYACIEVFATTRNLDWRGILLPHTHAGIPELHRDLKAIQPLISNQHYHQIVRYLNGTLGRPTAPDGRPQINIPDRIVDPQRWVGNQQDQGPVLKIDYTHEKEDWGFVFNCDICGSAEVCDCTVRSLPGGLVELVEYPNKGIGVRSLGNFKAGDILGLFLGELCPLDHDEYDYSLGLVKKNGMGDKAAVIAPLHYGNWTRFINHGCTPLTQFRARTVGARCLMTVEAIEDIKLFDEITVSYGRCYWRNMKCYLVQAHGDRTAVVSKHQNSRLTYSRLDAKSNALARGLESVGVRTGDRVGVMLGNSMEYAIATYALFKLGAILVPLNLSFNTTQVASALGHLEASHLIVSAESNLPRKDPRSNVPLLQHLVPDLCSSTLNSALIPSLRNVILVDNSSGRVNSSNYRSLTPYSSIMSESSADEHTLPPRSLSPHDIVNIQFTSGTTAMPKAACLSHRSILNNGAQIGDRMRLTPQDIVCCPPPLFHCFGCILGYMATATHGSAIVFPTESFNARAALTAVQEEKCTALYGVPTMFLEELGLLKDGEVSSEGFQHLRTGIAAGSSIPAALMTKLHQTLNLTELTICYGMTETSPVSAMTTTDDPIEKRINTVGRLMPHVEAKVVNPADHSQTLPITERGELAVSGYLLMKEYWNDVERTVEVMYPDKDGKVWMHTGDEASMSPDGYITITGRIKDLIIRGGENIHPLEIENCLLTCPGVSDVSVVGVPDERYGEAVAAFIIPRGQDGETTEETIREWVRHRLSHHLVPKYVFYLGAADAFPKTASGKIQKFKLREEAVKRLEAKNGGEF